jgi:predicted DNA-binding transcriptional regulator AlpA
MEVGMGDTFISPRVARERSGGISESTQRRLIEAGQYPKPVVLSRDRHGKPARIAFIERELAEWVATRIAADRSSRNPPSPRAA